MPLPMLCSFEESLVRANHDLECFLRMGSTEGFSRGSDVNNEVSSERRSIVQSVK